ncbi:MAG: hypothetical protein AAB036_11120 [Elusimicrobiota bacterium]
MAFLSRAASLRPLLGAGRVPPGRYVATGPRGMSAWFLRALLPALQRGGRVLWLDAGNAFDVHGLARAARAAGCDPKAVLSRVAIARPFNAFQLETMISKTAPSCWRGEPVVVADPMRLFYGEDVPVERARRVLRAVVDGMDALPCVWLILSVDRDAPAGRAGWLSELSRGSRGCAALRGELDAARLEASRR